MSDRATRQLARRGLPFDHPEVLADRVRRGLIPYVHVELAQDVAYWRDWPEDVLSDQVWRLFACDCAERALARVEQPDPRSVEAIRVARLFAVGEATEKELAGARSAARTVAWSAAAGSAWSAAWDVAGAAARDAAWDAAGAAGAAARDAAGAAERSWQLAAWNAEEDWQNRHLRRCLLLPGWPDWREAT